MLSPAPLSDQLSDQSTARDRSRDKPSPIRAIATRAELGAATRAAIGAAAVVTLALLLGASPASAEMPDIELDGDIEAGKKVAMNRATGNCVACHLMPGAESPGAIGPALIAMQTRYPSKREVAIQIWDPTIKNPEVVMPPFGKHGVLTNQEFVDVVEYIWSL